LSVISRNLDALDTGRERHSSLAALTPILEKFGKAGRIRAGFWAASIAGGPSWACADGFGRHSRNVFLAPK
jgi:hypothetical protein